MKSISVTKRSKNLNIVKDLYLTAFPKNEQIPFCFLLWKSRKENIDFLALYDDDNFIGLAYLIKNKDITFLFYFAISESFRSAGYGTKALDLIKRKYPGNRIILNIESPNVKSQNKQEREKRKEFYLKNGFNETNLCVVEYKVVYDMLVSNGKINAKEYYDITKSFFGSFLFFLFKPKLVKQKERC